MFVTDLPEQEANIPDGGADGEAPVALGQREHGGTDHRDGDAGKRLAAHGGGHATRNGPSLAGNSGGQGEE